MGAAIWIETQGRPFKETADDCCKMNRLADQLDALSIRLGVPEISSFFDYSKMAHLADAEIGVDDDLSEEQGGAPDVRDVTSEPVAERAAKGEWFDSAQGLAAIRTLRIHIAEHADAVNLPTGSDDDFERYRRELLEELQLCERFLGEAVSSRQPFRLLIVP